MQKLSTSLLFATVALLLGGCAYREINPERAQADARQAGGYKELERVNPGTAKLLMRSSGMAYPVSFTVSPVADRPCENTVPLRPVAYTGQGVVYPWIAKMTAATGGTKPYQLYTVALPDRPMTVNAVGHWSSNIPGPPGGVSTFSSGTCKAAARFTPRVGRAYTAELVWMNTNCRLDIKDATDSNAPQPVSVNAERPLACTAASSSGMETARQ